MKQRVTGDEQFTFHGTETGITVMDFWRWAFSDLNDSAQRGIMAEFLVHSVLNKTMPSQTCMRENQLLFNLTSPSGRRIEVKSASYIQSWTPENISAQICFSIEKKLTWDNMNETYAAMPKRNCDLYVFCLFTARVKDIPLLDLDYWDFYILPTSALEKKIPNQKSLTLSSLLKLRPAKTDYDGLGSMIESIKL